MGVTTSSARQSSIQQTASPSRSIALNLPLQSLSDSRVFVVVISTISGGAQSHIPTSQIWDQVPLIGTGGFAQVGEMLISAWLSKPGTVLYGGGSFQFAGFLGNSPEYAQIFSVELTNLRNGTLTLSQQVWNEDSTPSCAGYAEAIGQSLRNILAFAFAENHHQFTQPSSPFALLSQTANSGFFTAPFSASTNFATQNSNDRLNVDFPFDGVESAQGLLLFNVLAQSSAIDSIETVHGTRAFISYPQEQITTSAFLNFGGPVTQTVSGYIGVEPLTVIVRTEGELAGETIATGLLEANIYSLASPTFSTDAYLDFFFEITEEIDVELLGPVNKTLTTTGVVIIGGDVLSNSNGVIGKDFFHLTDAWILDPKAFHFTNGFNWKQNDLTHTTDASVTFQGNATQTVNAYLAAALPTEQTHATFGTTTADNILVMTGWELRDPLYECYYGFSPDYSGVAGLMTVTATAQRPGSAGGYGLRIDNTGYPANSWWLPYPCAKNFRDALGNEEVGTLGNFYSEVWFTLWFRPVDIPIGTGKYEQLLSDQYRVLGYTSGGGLGVPIYGCGFNVTIGMNAGDTYAMIGFGSAIDGTLNGLGTFNYIFSDPHGWHKLEVRAYMPDGVTKLINASLSNPAFLEGYIDGQLVMGSTTPYGIDATGILGVQNRFTTQRYRVDFDDYVVSTTRVGTFDLSVKIHSPKANGTYNAWTSTPAGDYSDVAALPVDVAKYKISSTVGQKASIKVYEGADTDPYPAVLHAVSFNLVRGTAAVPVNYLPSLKTFLKQGATEIDLFDWRPHVGWRAIALSSSIFNGGAWSDELYDLEYGVNKVVNATEHKVLNMSVCVLVSPFSYSQYVDSMLFGEGNLTLSTDALLATSQNHYTDSNITGQGLIYYADAAIYSSMSTLQFLDSTLQGETGGDMGTNAFVDRIFTMTTDTLVVSQQGSTHTADASLATTRDGWHMADGSIGALRDLPHTTDLSPYVLVEQVHNTDGLRIKLLEAFHLANGRMIKELSTTHTTTAILKATVLLTHLTNGVIYQLRESNHFTNAVKLGEKSLSISTNAYLLPVATLARFITTNTLISKAFETTHSSSAFLKDVGEINFSTDAKLIGEASQLHSTNSRLVFPDVISLVHTTSAKIIGAVDLTHTSTAVLKSTFSATHTSTAFIFKSPEISQTVSSALNMVRNITQTSSGFCYIVQIGRAHV